MFKIECISRPTEDDGDDYAVIGVIEEDSGTKWDVVLDSQDILNLLEAVDYEAGSWYLLEQVE